MKKRDKAVYIGGICLYFLLTIVMSGCGGRRPPANLLLITLDTTRADRLGCYGYRDAATPALDRLAANGILFEQAYTPVPLTLPAHASILTGLMPPEHGLKINGQNRLDPSITTLAEVLSDAGYETSAFLASFVLHSRFGLDQGFSVYDDNWIGEGSTGGGLRRQRDGRDVIDSAIKWLNGYKQKQPFFCWVHLYDPHTPYNPHIKQYGNTYIDRPYDGEIAYTDMQVGRFIESLKRRGLQENTLIVIVGDHGEGLGDHDERDHGVTLYNSVMHVPMIINMPGIPGKGLRIQEAVSLTDLYATLTDIIIGKPLVKPHSRSLYSACKGEGIDAQSVYGETDSPLLTYNWCPLRSIIDWPWKYIRSTRSELYNIQEDPDESHNLIDGKSDIASLLDEQLLVMENAFQRMSAPGVELSEADQRVLTSLGYTAGGTAGLSVPDGLPDVKDMLPLLNLSLDAQKLMRKGNFKEALRDLELIVSKDPGNLSFRFLLAKAQYRAEMYREAHAVLHSTIELISELTDPDLVAGVYSLNAAVLCAMGDIDGGIDCAREGVRLVPDSSKSVNALAWVLAVRGNQKQAAASVEWAKKAVELGGGDIAHLDTLAAAYASSGQFPAAAQTAEKALALARKEKRFQMAASIEKRLGLYRDGKPYREVAEIK